MDSVNVKNITGEGVVGLYPTIGPNTIDFYYESCNILQSNYGYMEGNLLFKKVEPDNGDNILVVKIDRFDL